MSIILSSAVNPVGEFIEIFSKKPNIIPDTEDKTLPSLTTLSKSLTISSFTSSFFWFSFSFISNIILYYDIDNI